jgi:hypothetical protein
MTRHATWVVAAATAAALTCLPGATRATNLTGNQLQDSCTNENYLEQGFCLGFMTALIDAAMSPNGAYGWHACPPPNATVGQGEDIVKRFLAQHPEKRQLTASSLAARALAEAFPCKP